MTLHVKRLGRRGPDLILVHGWGFSGAVWGPLADHLQSRYRLHVVDLPGNGYSPYVEGEYSLRSLGTLLSEQLADGALWLGWSLGGMLALEVAAKHPERVAGVCCVATSPRFVQGEGWPHAMPAPTLDGFAHDLLVDARRTLWRFTALQARGAPNQRALLTRLRASLDAAPAPDPRALRGGLVLLRGADLRPSLAAIRCPVRILLGARDTLVPAAVAGDIAGLRPDWPVRVLDGEGHAPFITQPALVAGALAEIALANA